MCIYYTIGGFSFFIFCELNGVHFTFGSFLFYLFGYHIDYFFAELAVICLAGVAWNVSGVLFLAPRLFKNAWFERAIAEYGQSSGVTATGLLLLRTVDPETKTVAAEAFGYKQLLHEPIMGGGIWTSLAVPLLLTQGFPVVVTVSVCMIVLWLLFWRFVLHPSKKYI